MTVFPSLPDFLLRFFRLPLHIGSEMFSAGVVRHQHMRRRRPSKCRRSFSCLEMPWGWRLI